VRDHGVVEAKMGFDELRRRQREPLLQADILEEVCRAIENQLSCTLV
jgi:hypothetical protein